ncbi:MAG: exosome complex protein Rrp4 [Caldisphaeraceae archaeon]|nr:exosome complex protein Rrp4 [Caldisphaeraceae archaeon]
MSSNKRIVVPGEVIEGITPSVQEFYAFNYGDTTRASMIGVLDIKQDGQTSFSPINGIYMPREGDVVIGLVTSHGVSNWFLDINSPYQAILSVQDFFGVRQNSQAPEDPFRYLQIGEFVKAKIAAFDRIRNPLLTVQDKGLGKIVEGSVIIIHPTKVARVIGRKGSMIETLKTTTGCEYFVAVNGAIHIKCDNKDLETIAETAIETIESQAHTSGLTERIKKFIEEERKIRGV